MVLEIFYSTFYNRLLFSDYSSCARCDKHVENSPICTECETPTSVCIVCDESVYGLVAVCSICGHGGHPEHVMQWFKEYDTCPAMCGCRCTR